MRLEHVNLTVSDLDRSAALYTELLGLKERWRGHTSGGARAVHLGTDDWYVALFEGAPQSPGTTYTNVGFNHFGVVVDDLDAVVARLDAFGLKAHMQSDVPPGRRAYFFDHDGLEVELVQY